LYNILSLLAGLGPKSGLEDLAKNSEVATKDLSALNKITPKGTVDEATMTAAQDAGLTGKFSKNSDGTYTYTGTQEDIDNAKSNANAEFGRVQSAIDEA
jgi:hypothetical protein